MKHCERCGGAIMRANTAYAYAGPVCSCVWQQPVVEAARPTDEDKAKWLGLALMEAQKLREENERLRAALTEAGATFDYYAKRHAEKVPPDVKKAESNAALAEMCAAALNT